MLERLEIQNLGIVGHVSLELKQGFTIFTGETGAGKSLLLSSLLLLSGTKADASYIKTNAEQAFIYSEWNIEQNTVALRWLEERGVDAPENLVHIRRVLKRKGRGQCFIQGAQVSVQELAEFFSYLCEIHTQHEHQSLFKQSEQTRIFHSFAKIDPLLRDYTQLSTQLSRDVQSLKQGDTQKEAFAREVDYLSYAIQEIENARLQDKEDETVLSQIQKISHAQETQELWNDFFQCLDAEEIGVLSLLNRGKTIIESLRQRDKDLDPIAQRLKSLLIEYEDVLESSKIHKKEEEDGNTRSLTELEQRLSLIEGLKKKYGKTIVDIRGYQSNAQKRLVEIENYEYDEGEIKKRIFAVFRKLFILSKEIYQKRHGISEHFSSQVNAILHHLAMPSAVFAVFQKKTEFMQLCESKSVDTLSEEELETLLFNHSLKLLAPIDFVIQTNRGEASSLLSKIVSGGELSRIMLAINIVGRAQGKQETLILDEVDAGLGGKTALALATYLFELSREQQIICVSHLPTVAAVAQEHFYVHKEEVDATTTVGIKNLQGEQREKELARMLVGNEEDVLAIQQAKKLLKVQ